ncbi:DUF935 family protein [Mucilaginibacter ximonensis]|uniref:DUF935 family protein n=1 Tax=Mucilaginibacter ximonensis TaxID=538021 RepID=A0ABW5YFB2_9SPHI
MSFKEQLNSVVNLFRGRSDVNLAAADYKPGTGLPVHQGQFLQHDLKSVFQTRKDIKDWRRAEALYYSQDPKTWMLQLLLNDIYKDATLTSQKENRTQQVFAREVRIKKKNGDIDKEQTDALKKMPLYRFLTHKVLDAIYYEYSVVELSMEQTIDGEQFLVGNDVPRTNIVPITGTFYKDYMDTVNGIQYRDMQEYGVWILEFWTKEMPLFNKAVPHVLFKRFAESCWSELCEIFGIPPRVLKTNTQDKKMMDRAQRMLKDMGAASWFIIDEDEEFEFAQGATTNGDVYHNLINLCNNEMSLLIAGAIIGQDTKNGNRSKEEVSKDLAALRVESDIAMVEEAWNNKIIPCLKRHGMLTGDITFEFVPVVNIKELYERVIGLLQYCEIDPKWISDALGIPILKLRDKLQPADQKQADKSKLKAFFD